MTPELLFLIIIGILIIDFIVDKYIDYLNSRRFDDRIPEELNDVYNEDEYYKSQSYKKENYRFSLITSSFKILLTLAFFLFKGFAWVDELARNFSSNEITIALIFFGVIMIGSHFIKGWSRTQNHVTMSSAEAELIALVKCTTECMGAQSMFRDWGNSMNCNLYADSSAALAIAKRKGAGKLRHINVGALWIQDVQDREGATYMKVFGTANPADLMTKYLTREKVDNTIDKMCLTITVITRIRSIRHSCSRGRYW